MTNSSNIIHFCDFKVLILHIYVSLEQLLNSFEIQKFWTGNLGPYSQNLIFFITLESAQYASLLHDIKL
jgi:hypothetical protein